MRSYKQWTHDCKTDARDEGDTSRLQFYGGVFCELFEEAKDLKAANKSVKVAPRTLLDGFKIQFIWNHETKAHEARPEPFHSQQNKVEDYLTEGKTERNSKTEAEAEASDRALEVLPASFAEEEWVRDSSEVRGQTRRMRSKRIGASMSALLGGNEYTWPLRLESNH